MARNLFVIMYCTYIVVPGILLKRDDVPCQKYVVQACLVSQFELTRRSGNFERGAVVDQCETRIRSGRGYAMLPRKIRQVLVRLFVCLILELSCSISFLVDLSGRCSRC